MDAPRSATSSPTNSDGGFAVIDYQGDSPLKVGEVKGLMAEFLALGDGVVLEGSNLRKFDEMLSKLNSLKHGDKGPLGNALEKIPTLEAQAGLMRGESMDSKSRVLPFFRNL